MRLAHRIPLGDVALEIALIPTGRLRLHEETIPELTEEIASSIEREKVLKNPIMVDKSSYVVLDGMHRVEAAKRVGCGRVPACLVDYFHPAVKVGVWYRAIDGESLTETVEALASKLKLRLRESSLRGAEEALSRGLASASFLTKGKCFIVEGKGGLKEAYRIVKLLEEGLVKVGKKVGYETEVDAKNKLLHGKVKMVMAVPPVRKEDVVSFGLSGSPFPHKVTRHVVPARPMRVNAPLSLLKDKSLSLEEASALLAKSLSGRRVRRIPPGSMFEGRRYEEEIFLFE